MNVEITFNEGVEGMRAMAAFIAGLVREGIVFLVRDEPIKAVKTVIITGGY